MSGKYGARNRAGNHVIAQDDPHAISLPKQEHHVFRDLFDEGAKATLKQLAEIARELSMRLTVHMAIEEEDVALFEKA